LSLGVDLKGRISGSVTSEIYKNVVFSASGKRTANISDMDATLGWSEDKFNVRTTVFADTQKPRTTCTVDYVYRLSDRWSVGNYVTFDNDTGGPAMSDRCWCANVKLLHTVGYGGALGYDGDRNTALAVLDKDANAKLKYLYRVNDWLSVGAGLAVDFRRNKAKMTWMHRATFDDGLEIRGEEAFAPNSLAKRLLEFRAIFSNFPRTIFHYDWLSFLTPVPYYTLLATFRSRIYIILPASVIFARFTRSRAARRSFDIRVTKINTTNKATRVHHRSVEFGRNSDRTNPQSSTKYRQRRRQRVIKPQEKRTRIRRGSNHRLGTVILRKRVWSSFRF